MSIRKWFKGAKAKAMIVLGSFAMLLGVGASVSVATAVKENEVVETKADFSKAASSRIYVNTGGQSSGWAKDGAKLSAWVWYSGGSAWSDVHWDASTEYYYFELSSTATGLTFVRGTAYKDWNAKWNQADVSFSAATNNLLNATPTDGTIGSPAWSEFKIQNSGATIYVDTGGQYSTWASDSVNLYAWCWKTNGCEWAALTWDSSYALYKFALPGNSTGFTLLRTNDTPSGTSWGSPTDWGTDDAVFDSSKTVIQAGYTSGSFWLGSWRYLPDSYIYYVSAAGFNEDTPDYIYMWGSGKQFGNFPGSRITSITGVQAVQGTIEIEGSAVKIYKIPYSSSYSDTQFLFNAGSDTYQTADFDLTPGAAYTWEDQTKCVARGAALELMIEEERYRSAATWNDHEGSICGISQSIASSLYVKYSSTIGASAKAIVDASSTTTYTDRTASATGSIGFDKIFAQLGKLGGNISSAGIVHDPTSDQSPLTLTLWIVLGAGVLGLGAIGTAYFVSKKKKRHQA